MSVPYRSLSSYFKEKYGTRVGKICIDGGFTCPNRDGKCGVGGCIYCGERGAGEHIPEGSIREQAERVLSRGKYGAYVAYFQNFTNTYAPTDVLRARYDEALFDPRVKVLAVGTRPDCISDEIAALLASYRDRVDVWVELGLQTANDETAEKINRGYPSEVFLRAVSILRRYGLPFVVHLMIGLPDESMEDIRATADLVASTRPFGVKIHGIYVMKGTRLADLFLQKLYTPPTLDFYLDAVVEILSRLPEDTVIHRLTGDCPAGMLLAPDWNSDKNRLLTLIRERLERRG